MTGEDPIAAAVVALVEAIRAEVRAEVVATSVRTDRLLSIPQAGALLGVGRTSVYRAIQSGQLRSVHVGRRRLIAESAIAEFTAR